MNEWLLNIFSQRTPSTYTFYKLRKLQSGATLKEEHTLRLYENRVLRRMFGPHREELAGGWRRLHNEELHNLYALPNIIRVIKLRKMR
jgi:hypothetical protein